ncbi:MAG TPA: alcohol dehydrogenase [Verrucomicrobiales bacterium]|nr:alcohol dehydrogenase [Verrucomicrobiales bacterium]
MRNDSSAHEKTESPGTSRPSTGAHRPLRVWPALVLVALMAVMRFGPGLMEDGRSTLWMVVVFGPMLCSLLLLIWWLAASRATGRERLLGFLGLIGVIIGVTFLLHPTMIGPGMSYLMIPMGMAAFALGAAVLARRRPLARTGVPLVLTLAGCSISLLFRNDGMTGNFGMDLHWRWTPTAEEQLLASLDAGSRKAPLVSTPAPGEVPGEADWPGFRGPNRNGRSAGPVVATDWAARPPELLWKVRVGPGWSSFAVAGDRLFTQEQRGPDEMIVCYSATDGRELWTRGLELRFDEPLGGPGPRATPTLVNGALFVTGATGMLMRLDPASGEILWQQDMREVAGRDLPMWGFAASPLVAGPVVVVHAGGSGDKGVLAFDVESGQLRWSAAAGDHSYSSPQLETVAGEPTVLMLSNEGLRLLNPETGAERLNYEWKFAGYRALQPHVLDDETILLPTGPNLGTRAIRVSKTGDGLTAEELWTSRNLKPDFSDFVVFEGNAYGFDGGIFACVDLGTGERKWKGGRYGKGQVLLLESSGLLLIASERGEAVLVRADPADHVEVARFQALEGKTWNHPVVVGDRLYLRNAEEAAGYRLPLAKAASAVLQ